MNREYFNRYTKEYYVTRKNEYIALLGGKCASCGTDQDLEFDHIDPKTKLFEITNFLSYSKDVVLTELKKCQLLCKEEHHLKTQRENSKRVPWNKGKWEHGTWTAYCSKGCRCDPCKLAGSLYKKNQRRVARSAC